MRQIDDLDHKRQQRLAETDQLPDCPVRTWDFVGFVEPEYRKDLPPLEPESVEQPETSKEPEPMVTPATFTEVASLDLVNDNSDPNGIYGVPESDLDRMGSFEPDGESHFNTAFEEVTYSQRNDTGLPAFDIFEDSLFFAPSTDAASNQLDSAELTYLQQEMQDSAPTKQVSMTGENVNNDNGFLVGSGNKQLDPASVSFQVVGEPQIPENASAASSITQQPCLEEQAAQDDDSLFGDDVEEISFETAPSPDQTVCEPQTSRNTGSDVHDTSGFLNSGPITQPDHGPGAQLDQGSEALYTQELEASSAHGLEAEPQAADQPAPENQTAQDAAPVEQVAFASPDFQPTADQIEATSGEGAPAPLMPQDPMDTVLDYKEYRQTLEYPPEHYHQIAREKLARFWPGNKQNCSNTQLEMFATGCEQFQQNELAVYEQYYKEGATYFVYFADDFIEFPSNLSVRTVCNGYAKFRCLEDKLPAQDGSHDKPLDVVDLTGDASNTADPLGVQEPALAPPADIVAADEVLSAAAGAQSVANGPATSEGQEAATRKAPKIPTIPPVDEVTFAQGPVSLTNNAEPTTPMQSDADGNSDTWSSDWSGKAFTNGGQPPKTPSNQEIGVMEYSVTSDNSSRGVKATKQADNAPGSLSSVHNAHNALNHQLSQTSQAAGNVHAPPSAEPTKRGNKRGRKNAGAAADTDVSQGQQHGTPEHQPAQYYGVSPDHNLDAKKWVEDHTQGGKGKRGQKRKAAATKKTPTPRKARKAEEANPSAPARSYCNIAPAPPRNQGDVNNVQMQSRSSTPMGYGGAVGSLTNTEMNGNGIQMYSAAPFIQDGQSQQMPPQQGPQNLMGHQIHCANALQPPLSLQEKIAKAKSEREWLTKQMGRLDEEVTNLMSNHPMEQGDWHPPQQGFQHPSQQNFQQPSQHGIQQPSQYGFQHPPPQGFQQPPQQGFQQPLQQNTSQPQSHEMTSDEALLKEFQRYEEFQRYKEMRKLMESQQMAQPHMAMPRTMPSQHMPSNGVPSFSMSMHTSYRQASPSIGYPPAGDFTHNGYPAANSLTQNGYTPASNLLQNGYPAADNFPWNGYQAHVNVNPIQQGTNGQPMYGGHNAGIGGAYMAQQGMPDFSS